MKKEISNALPFLKDDKLILYPTDTVWGIGCDATATSAVERIFSLKKRAESKSLIVLVSSLQMLKDYVDVPSKAINILKTSNRPTTIIYNNPKGLAKNTIANNNTVAIRIVQHEFCKKLIQEFGKPIVSTSANISGEPTPSSFSEISTAIREGVDYIVNLQQENQTSQPSTILKIIGEEIEVLRA